MCFRANKHDGLKFNKCEECDSSFATKVELQQHRLYHREPTQTCSMCSKAFRTRATLMDHLASHSFHLLLVFNYVFLFHYNICLTCIGMYQCDYFCDYIICDFFLFYEIIKIQGYFLY